MKIVRYSLAVPQKYIHIKTIRVSEVFSIIMSFDMSSRTPFKGLAILFDCVRFGQMKSLYMY